MFAMSILEDADLEAMIRDGKSDRLEFASVAMDLDAVRESLCAFANDLPNNRSPGLLLVRINDDGFGNAESVIDDEFLLKLDSLRNDGKIMPFLSMDVAKRRLRGGEVAVIQVEPSGKPPVKMDGRCWVRVGPLTTLATQADELRLMEKSRLRHLPFDALAVPGATIADLDLNMLEHAYLPAQFPQDVLAQNDRTQKDQLRALHLLSASDEPTAAAILMLGQDSRAWFPDAYIQFVRYGGTEATDPVLAEKEIAGTLPDQARQLEQLLDIHITSRLERGGLVHKRLTDYPMRALREFAINAIIHREYENANLPVRISWLEDRVEINSPGGCHENVNRANFGQPGATSYRNPVIASSMKALGYGQKFGTGIAKARAELKQNGNPPPHIHVETTSSRFKSIAMPCGHEKHPPASAAAAGKATLPLPTSWRGCSPIWGNTSWLLSWIPNGFERHTPA